jgi:hypothetical protein
MATLVNGVTIPEYKERYGLNRSAPLETPRLTDLRRQNNREHEGWRNLVGDYHFTRGGPITRHPVRAQFLREHYNPEKQRQRRRVWSDEELLAFLKEQQAQQGGQLRLASLAKDRPGVRGLKPSLNAVLRRFGSWRRICELLGQPYHTGRFRATGRGSNRGISGPAGGRA